MNAISARYRTARKAVRVAFVLSAASPALQATGSSFDLGNVATGDPVALRGMMSAGGVTRFRVCEPAAHRAAWLAEGERSGDIVVVAYDASTNSVVVERLGVKITLTLPNAAVGSAAAAEPPSSLSLPSASLSRPLDITAESRAHGIVRR